MAITAGQRLTYHLNHEQDDTGNDKSMETVINVNRSLKYNIYIYIYIYIYNVSETCCFHWLH